MQRRYMEGRMKEGIRDKCRGGKSEGGCELLHGLGIVRNPTFSCWHCTPGYQGQSAVA